MRYRLFYLFKALDKMYLVAEVYFDNDDSDLSKCVILSYILAKSSFVCSLLRVLISIWLMVGYIDRKVFFAFFLIILNAKQV